MVRRVGQLYWTVPRRPARFVSPVPRRPARFVSPVPTVFPVPIGSVPIGFRCRFHPPPDRIRLGPSPPRFLSFPARWFSALSRYCARRKNQHRNAYQTDRRHERNRREPRGVSLTVTNSQRWRSRWCRFPTPLEAVSGAFPPCLRSHPPRCHKRSHKRNVSDAMTMT